MTGLSAPIDGREPVRVRRFRAAVLLFFLTSGATGLVLEVVYARILGTVFGNTVYAASTVLTAFMLGLALGSAVLGRLADRVRRPLALYGCLELGVGLYALLFPLLVEASGAFYGWFYRSAGPGFALLNAVRLPMSLLLLLPPTFLMGGTLPVLGRHLGASHGRPGQEVGYLYGANTLGAVVGCFLAGFVLLEALGVRGSLTAAGGAAMAVGVLALLLGLRRSAAAGSGVGCEAALALQDSPTAETAVGHTGKMPVPRRGPVEPIDAATFRLVLAAYAVTGFCALAYEVLWTRVLIFVLTTSVHAFATMLTTFLAGLAGGSFLSARLLVRRVRRPVLWFGAIEVLVGLAALGSIPLLARLGAIDVGLSQAISWGGSWRLALARSGDALLVLFVPAVLMGAAFPIVTSCCIRGAASLGRRVGQVYAANTVGCVLGAFAGGFLLLPALGAPRSLLAVISLNVAVGVVLICRSAVRSNLRRGAVAVPAAALLVAALLLTPRDVFHQTINTYHHPSRIAFLRDHSTGTVTVHDLPNGERLMSVDGVNVAGLDFMLRSTQKLQGYIPLCLHPAPRRVVQIGFGSGETARVGLAMGVAQYTVVEICPAIFEGAALFERINAGSYRDERIRRIIMDGKNFAALSGETFDVVMNDSTYPGSGGSSALYTVDHFRSCRRRLAPGGLFSCWVPLDLRPREMKMILRSFQEAFPHCSFWVASNCLNKHGLILGSLAPLRIDLARVRAVLRRPAVAADLHAIAINNAYDLLDCHVLDEVAIRALVAGEPVNSDDRPLLEFSCARPACPDAKLRGVLAMAALHRVPIGPYVVGWVDPARDRAELARRFGATQHVFRAQVAQLAGEPTARRRELALAREANPGEVHVASCQEELRREIRDLRRALAARPHCTPLALRLADRLYVACQDDQAAPLYRQLVEGAAAAPAPAYVRLAEIRFRVGRAGEAEQILCRCLDHHPHSADAHDRLAGICLRTGRLDRARHHITEALRLAPGDARYEAHRDAILAAER